MAGPGRPREEGLRERFFDAALVLLAADGYAGLKLAVLVRRLGLTTGAFYHSFASWKEFTDELLEHWYDARNAQLAVAMSRLGDAQDQMMFLRHAALDLQHESESAIRAWAAADPSVRDVVRRVDQVRLEVSVEALTNFTGDATASRQLALAAVFMVAGYGQTQVGRHPDALEAGMRLIQLGAERIRAGQASLI